MTDKDDDDDIVERKKDLDTQSNASYFFNDEDL